MSDFYDRHGQPISFEEWAARFEDDEYRRVATTTLEGGGCVSTVWLGLDHGFGVAPQIFESMAFLPNGVGTEQFRYASEKEAKQGHREMVERWEQGSSAHG